MNALRLLPLLALWTLACAREGRPGSVAEAPEPPGSPPPVATGSPDAGVQDPEADLPLVVVLGDSIAAGYGLPEDDAFPALVAEDLRERGRPVRMVNAGVSGDTSAGGVARLDWLLRQQPDLVLLELGANDGLRGLPVAALDANLRRIVERSRAAGADVVLAGMVMPPNYGPEYAQAFSDVFPRVARELEVPLIPFLLEGVGGVAELNLPDGIHPTAEGHRRIADVVLPYVEAALAARDDEERTRATGAGGAP